MSAGTPDDLRREIWELLQTADEVNVSQAIDLTSLLPVPSDVPDELTAQCLFDSGFSAEYFGKDDLAIELYRRVLAYPVKDTKYPASAWFRIGVCIGRQGKLSEAIHCYREALRIARDLPHTTTLAHYNLAELVEASENYQEAAELYAKVLPMLPHPDIHRSRALLGYARCSWRSRNVERAKGLLKELAANADDPVSAEAWRLLAEIAEEGRDYAEADRAYRQIIANPHSDPNLRGAAAYRLASLKRIVG